MSCTSYIKPTQKRLLALSDTVVQYEWFTDWLPAIAIDLIRMVLKNKAVTGNFESRLCIQTASVRTDVPGEPVLLDSYRGSGEFCQDVTVSSNTGSKHFVRFGVAYHLSAQGSPGQADVSLEISYDACGRIVAGGTHQLTIPSNSVSYYLPITGWLTALQAAKVKAALSAYNVSANVEIQLAFRTAATSREVTSSWSNEWEGSSSWHGGNSEWNTGELSLSTGSPTAKMWVQIGLQFRMTSGSNGQASVATSVAVRKS